MLRSKSSSNKAFIFVLELGIAFIIFMSFISVAYIKPSYVQESILNAREKEVLSNTLAILDRNGYLLEVTDSNNYTSTEKMDLIYAKIKSMLPSNYEARISLDNYQADLNDCKLYGTFQSCFDKISSFSPTGEELPTNKSILHERLLLPKKEPPFQCTLGAIFKPKENEIFNKIFFEKQDKVNKISFSEKQKLFFAGLDDLNTPFDINVRLTPNQSTFSCGEDIRADLNIKVKDVNIAARNYVDMELVFNDSTHMLPQTMKWGSFSSGVAQGGTGTCANPSGGWISLPSLTHIKDYDKKDYDAITATMVYTGSPSCTPRLRVLEDATPLPNSNGTASSSPISVNINPPNNKDVTYTVQIWSNGPINYDVNISLTKAYSTKAVLIDFLHYSSWQKSGNDGDYIGVISYNGGVEQNLQVAQANSDVSRIQNLQYTLNTAPLGNAIRTARIELLANNGQRPKVKDYMIIISDGNSTAGTYNALTEAQTAKDNNISIYSVGVGVDVNDVQLKQIASIGGGKYYYISDFNAIITLINTLAQDLTNNAAGTGNQVLVGANLIIPAMSCSYYVDLNGGICSQAGDRNILTYSIGDLNYGNSWVRHYTTNIPCNSRDACSISQLVLPPHDTNINWLDSNLVMHITDWNSHITANFLYRDLAIEIINASIDSSGEVVIDLNVKNIGLLSSNSTNLDFYLNDPYTGIFMQNEAISALNPGQFRLLLNEKLFSEGWIYALLNKDYIIPECPGNNIASVYCSGSPKTDYFVLDVWVWKK